MKNSSACLTSPRSTLIPTFPQSSRRNFPPTTVKQICTYRVILTDIACNDRQSLQPVFDHPISRDELDAWLTPWYNLGYSLVEVMSSQWKVQNPATGEYEVVWNRE